MERFQRYEIKKNNSSSDEFELILYLDDGLMEFANELGTAPTSRTDFLITAKRIVNRSYPNLKVSMVKVILGGIVITSIPLSAKKGTAQAEEPTTSQVDHTNTIFYQVASGDTLWIVARKFHTTIDDIKRANNFLSDILQVNQRLIIPKAFHRVKTGDYLTVLAKNYGTTVEAIKEANNLTSEVTRIGQTLIIPVLINGKQQTNKTQTSQQTNQSQTQFLSYTVVSGDSLSVIAKRFGVSVEALKSTNYLSSDLLRSEQVLRIPPKNTIGKVAAPEPIRVISTYKVVSGDSLSMIAQRFGQTVDTLKRSNSLSSDLLQVGQVLTIPSNETFVTESRPIKSK